LLLLLGLTFELENLLIGEPAGAVTVAVPTVSSRARLDVGRRSEDGLSARHLGDTTSLGRFVVIDVAVVRWLAHGYAGN